ncbi:MAG TPA: dihydropteroate synthase [Nitrospirales bacterium]|nr:dihydropteroate synthase [Nitrospirales bacterium]
MAFGPLRCRGHVLPVDERVLLMGVLNVTPDSFSDGGVYVAPATAVQRAITMVEEGADLIDIGAESTRPGADPVDAAEEWRRLEPVLHELSRRLTVPISIDTTKADIAQRALDAGAAMINDVSGLQADPRMARTVAGANAGVVLMHRRGTPKTMQSLTQYDDVVEEVRAALAERLTAAQEAGIALDGILLDPGIGFGKNLPQNLALLANLERLLTLNRPLLAGPSRKAFIGTLTGRDIAARMPGTAAAVALAVAYGARVVRVHDVGPMRDVVRVAEAIRSARIAEHESATMGDA